jgi:hypothetical protein
VRYTPTDKIPRRFYNRECGQYYEGGHKKNVYIAYVVVSFDYDNSSDLIVLLLPPPLFHILPTTAEAFIICGTSFPVDTSLCHVLSAIVSQPFPPRTHLQTCCSQNLLQRNGIRLAVNSPDIITVNVASLFRKLYAM